MPPYQWQQAWQRSRRKDLLEGQQEAHKARVSPELWDGSSCLDKRDGIAPRAMHWCFECSLLTALFHVLWNHKVPPLSGEVVGFYPCWEKQMLTDPALPA